MGYRRRWASGLVCVLMAAGALRASAGSISIEGDAPPEDGDSLPQPPAACQGAPATFIFHSQGPLLWGTRPSWDPDVPPEYPSSVLMAIDVGDGLAALRQADGQLSGESLVGTTIRGVDSSGTPVDVNICGTDSATDPGTTWHWIEAWNPRSQAWENPCLATSDVPNPRAVLLAGYWDASGAHHADDRKVTVACESGALAKCVTWGYRPWDVRPREGSWETLETAHQACTRMVRADYCGNGVSHTQSGTLIDYYDFVGVATLDPPGAMPPWESFEAAWGPYGAVCVSTQLRNGDPVRVLLSECGASFGLIAGDGAYLQYGDLCRYGRRGSPVGSQDPWYAVLRNRTSRFGY